LRRVWVVNVVQINVHHTHGEIRLHADDAVGEMLAVRIRGHQEARTAHQVVEGVEAVVQGQGHFVALLADHGQRSAVRRAVRPDPDARFLAGDFADFSEMVATSLLHPSAELLFGLIALGERIKAQVAAAGCRLPCGLARMPLWLASVCAAISTSPDCEISRT
jgi:hypothetical protein